jgi:hypothetical protein
MSMDRSRVALRASILLRGWPEDVSREFSLMVIGSFSVQAETRISRQPCAPFA